MMANYILYPHDADCDFLSAMFPYKGDQLTGFRHNIAMEILKRTVGTPPGRTPTLDACTSYSMDVGLVYA